MEKPTRSRLASFFTSRTQPSAVATTMESVAQTKQWFAQQQVTSPKTLQLQQIVLGTPAS
jgi:hypothetical protein